MNNNFLITEIVKAFQLKGFHPLEDFFFNEGKAELYVGDETIDWLKTSKPSLWASAMEELEMFWLTDIHCLLQPKRKQCL
jgi:hypothetical protein